MADYPTNVASYGQNKFVNTANLASSTLNVTISPTDNSLDVQSANSSYDWPLTNFTVRVNDELIFVSSRTTNTLNGLIRGYDGTTAGTHETGDRVTVVVPSNTLQYAFNELIATQTELDSHKSAVDPHPQYTTQAELDGTITTHENGADPHPQYQLASDKGQPDGYAELDSSGKVPVSQLPAISLSEVYVTADIPTRDALIVQEGDVSVVTDRGDGLSESYIYDGSQWLTITTVSEVTSVNGQTGAVQLTSDDVPEGIVNLYFTDPNRRQVLLNLFNSDTEDGVSTSYDDTTDVLTITNTDKGSEAVAIHEGEVDPHPQYLTEVEADALYASGSTPVVTEDPVVNMQPNSTYIGTDDESQTFTIPTTGASVGDRFTVIAEQPFKITGEDLNIFGTTKTTDDNSFVYSVSEKGLIKWNVDDTVLPLEWAIDGVSSPKFIAYRPESDGEKQYFIYDDSSSTVFTINTNNRVVNAVYVPHTVNGMTYRVNTEGGRAVLFLNDVGELYAIDTSNDNISLLTTFDTLDTAGLGYISSVDGGPLYVTITPSTYDIIRVNVNGTTHSTIHSSLTQALDCEVKGDSGSGYEVYYTTSDDVLHVLDNTGTQTLEYTLPTGVSGLTVVSDDLYSYATCVINSNGIIFKSFRGHENKPRYDVSFDMKYVTEANGVFIAADDVNFYSFIDDNIGGVTTTPHSIGSIRGLAYQPAIDGGENVWAIDGATDEIITLDMNLSEVARYPAPSTNPRGIAIQPTSNGGPYIWTGDGTIGTLFQLNPATLLEVSQVTGVSPGTYDLSWAAHITDTTSMWVSNDVEQDISLINVADATYIDASSAPGASPRSIDAGLGNSLMWVSNNELTSLRVIDLDYHNMYYEHDPLSHINGIAWRSAENGGPSLVVTDGSTIYELDSRSANVINSFAVSNAPLDAISVKDGNVFCISDTSIVEYGFDGVQLGNIAITREVVGATDDFVTLRRLIGSDIISTTGGTATNVGVVINDKLLSIDMGSGDVSDITSGDKSTLYNISELSEGGVNLPTYSGAILGNAALSGNKTSINDSTWSIVNGGFTNDVSTINFTLTTSINIPLRAVQGVINISTNSSNTNTNTNLNGTLNSNFTVNTTSVDNSNFHGNWQGNLVSLTGRYTQQLSKLKLIGNIYIIDNQARNAYIITDTTYTQDNTVLTGLPTIIISGCQYERDGKQYLLLTHEYTPTLSIYEWDGTQWILSTDHTITASTTNRIYTDIFKYNGKYHVITLGGETVSGLTLDGDEWVDNPNIITGLEATGSNDSIQIIQYKDTITALLNKSTGTTLTYMWNGESWLDYSSVATSVATLDESTGTVTSLKLSPVTGSTSITYQPPEDGGPYYWVNSTTTGKYYKLDPTTYDIIETVEAPYQTATPHSLQWTKGTDYALQSLTNYNHIELIVTQVDGNGKPVKLITLTETGNSKVVYP